MATFLLKSWLWLVGLSLAVFALPLQPALVASPVITAANIQQLRSVYRLDFASLGTFQSGWFAMSDDGDRLLVVSADGIRYDVDLPAGRVYQTPLPADRNGYTVQLITAALQFRRQPAFSYRAEAVAYTFDSAYCVAYWGDWSGALSGDSWRQCAAQPGIPQALWFDGAAVWLEVVDSLDWTIRLLRLPCADRAATFSLADCHQVPYAPAQDSEAVVRLGRIMPPYAVTSSAAGLVKLWDLQRGQVIATATTAQGVPAVFGQLNNAATHLVWRDERSHSLRLLDFMTGEDRYIAPLNGAYAQFLFLSPAADVALAVNLGFEPHVFAWDTRSGKRYDLGAYRPCGRVPDAVQMSRDGTTLVIGCDTGLDVWRIAP